MSEQTNRLKINIDYQRKEPPVKKPVKLGTGEEIDNEPEPQEEWTNQLMTQMYINYAVNKIYPNGLKGGSNRRMLGRIQRKLEEAVEAKGEDIELNEYEIKFLKDVFNKEELEFPTYDAKFVTLLEDEIAKLV